MGILKEACERSPAKIPLIEGVIERLAAKKKRDAMRCKTLWFDESKPKAFVWKLVGWKRNMRCISKEFIRLHSYS